MRSKDEDKIRAIAGYINDRYFEEGYVPSFAEIGSVLGMTKSNVCQYVAEMTRRGLVERNGSRGGICTPEMKRERNTRSRVPLIGTVACGTPIFAEENIETYLYLSDELTGRGEFFALKARGDSMVNAGIADGDIVLVRKQNTAENGEIAVALVGDEATLKRFYRENGVIRLHPENDGMEDMFFDYVDVQGVAKKVIKDLN